MELLTIILKILGAAVSLISGLASLNISTRQGNSLTYFGKATLFSLIFGFILSSTGVLLDWKLKSDDDLRHEEEVHNLQQAADSQRYGTGDADVSVTISIDKTLPDLQPLILRLDDTLDFAKSHCREPGGIAVCKDFVIRSVIIDELRFNESSALFTSIKGNKALFGILTKIGVAVTFYRDIFYPNHNPENDILGQIIITPSTLSTRAWYEYDGNRLRMFYEARLPPEAFKRAGVLSIVDLAGKGGTARPFARGIDVCPLDSITHDCDIHLLKLLQSTNIESVSFLFPHRKDFSFDSSMTHAEDNFGIKYIYNNFPSSLNEFYDDPVFK